MKRYIYVIVVFLFGITTVANDVCGFYETRSIYLFLHNNDTHEMIFMPSDLCSSVGYGHWKQLGDTIIIKHDDNPYYDIYTMALSGGSLLRGVDTLIVYGDTIRSLRMDANMIKGDSTKFYFNNLRKINAKDSWIVPEIEQRSSKALYQVNLKDYKIFKNAIKFAQKISIKYHNCFLFLNDDGSSILCYLYSINDRNYIKIIKINSSSSLTTLTIRYPESIDWANDSQCYMQSVNTVLDERGYWIEQFSEPNAPGKLYSQKAVFFLDGKAYHLGGRLDLIKEYNDGNLTFYRNLSNLLNFIPAI